MAHGTTPGRTPPLRAAFLVKIVLYCRVSTADQTLAHQRTQAEQTGFSPDLVLADHGISGISTRLAERPEAAAIETVSFPKNLSDLPNGITG